MNVIDAKDIDLQKMLDLAIYAFLRLDGAWFLAISKQYGLDVATELDVQAWETFSERLGRKIVRSMNLEGEFSDIFPVLMTIQNNLMGMKSEIIISGEDRAVIRVNDCEVWKMVSKVWTSETAPCYKVTQASIRGLLKGAFPGAKFTIDHKQKIPLGDPCCEMEIMKQDTR